jgi:hypothetical protein
VPEAWRAPLSRVSGLYARSAIVGPLPLPLAQLSAERRPANPQEVIRLDVDGALPAGYDRQRDD